MRVAVFDGWQSTPSSIAAAAPPRADPEIGSKGRRSLAHGWDRGGCRADRRRRVRVRCKAIAERGESCVIVGGGDGTISAAASAIVGPRQGSASCRSGRSTISRATSASPQNSTKPPKLIAAGRTPRRRRGDERPYIHQQQRHRALSADGPSTVTPAEAARPKQAAGDARGFSADACPFPPPAADADRQRRKGAGRHAAAVRRQQRLSPRYRCPRRSAKALEDGELSVFVMRKKTRVASLPRASEPCSTARETTNGQLKNVERLRVASRTIGARGFARRRSGARRASAGL